VGTERGERVIVLAKAFCTKRRAGLPVIAGLSCS